MKEQNYSNHRRLVPLYHIYTLILLLLLGAGSIIHFSHTLSYGKGRLDAAMMVIAFLCLSSVYFYARLFALRAQDRAVRAEENLRHFALTGKLLDPRLSMSQIIALRFAKDEEFIELAKKAADENMEREDIKKAIRNWRADHYRV